MRILVGLACVAVVAFVGYFFWGEWQKHTAKERMVSGIVEGINSSEYGRSAAMRNIEMLTKTAPSDRNTVSTMCKHLIALTNPSLAGLGPYVEDCRRLGY